MIFVCPQPGRWGRIYLALMDAWKASGRSGDEPPIPLILNGWVGSNDFEKKQRWQETVDWASRHGLKHLIPELDESEKYQVVALSSFIPGVFREPFEKPKVTPSKEDLIQKLDRLKASWSSVVGEKLGQHTFPIRFTGRKKRQLFMRADRHHNPPWGRWNSFTREGDRQAFKQFRKNINKAIAPHGVDHVVFREEDRWIQPNGKPLNGRVDSFGK